MFLLLVSMLDEKLLKKLRCVECGSTDLVYLDDKKLIKCKKCGAEYKVVEDIPIMLTKEELRKSYNVKVFEENAERYDNWFEGEKGRILFRNEVNAFKKAMNGFELGDSLEVGVGTGRFARELGIKFGVDPSFRELLIAKKRGIKVVQGVSEELPFRRDSFNSAFMIVTICFVEDPVKSLEGINNVLSIGGLVFVGFINKDSEWGEVYLEKKRRGHLFYKNVNFYSSREVIGFLESTGFEVFRAYSTLLGSPYDSPKLEEPVEGSDGGFVILVGKKTVDVN